MAIYWRQCEQESMGENPCIIQRTADFAEDKDDVLCFIMGS